MKVTNLEFKICDCWGTNDWLVGKFNDEKLPENRAKMATQKEVEKKINKVLESIGDNLVDIKINFVQLKQHNNAGANSIMEYVTIISR